MSIYGIRPFGEKRFSLEELDGFQVRENVFGGYAIVRIHGNMRSIRWRLDVEISQQRLKITKLGNLPVHKALYEDIIHTVAEGIEAVARAHEEKKKSMRQRPRQKKDVDISHVRQGSLLF